MEVKVPSNRSLQATSMKYFPALSHHISCTRIWQVWLLKVAAFQQSVAFSVCSNPCVSVFLFSDRKVHHIETAYLWLNSGQTGSILLHLEFTLRCILLDVSNDSGSCCSQMFSWPCDSAEACPDAFDYCNILPQWLCQWYMCMIRIAWWEPRVFHQNVITAAVPKMQSLTCGSFLISTSKSYPNL